MFSLGTFNSTQAQFINPTTNDDFAGCTVPNVENTGTASWGDLQVIVVDGDEPSIVFVDHSTSPATTQCFYLEAFNQGFSGAKDVNISLPEQLPQAMYFVLVRKANGSLDKILVQKW